MNHFLRLAVSTITIATLLSACEYMRSPDGCDLDQTAMSDAISESVSSALFCNVDQDCGLLDPSNGCFGTCQVAVNVDEISRVDEEIAVADLQYCTGFPQQCGYSTPSCPQLEAQCIAGTCQLVDMVAAQ